MSLLLFINFLSFASAVQIVFNAVPTSVYPGITQKLTVRCSLKDDSTVVGRRQTRDLAHVTSIVISRRNPYTQINETVGSVTSFDPATAVVDAGKLTAQGTTRSTTGGEIAFLELAWTHPTAGQHAYYYCEVFTLNTEQHPENYEAVVEVGVTSPSTTEIMLYIANLENRTATLEAKIATLSSSNLQTGVIQCQQGTRDYPITFSPAFTHVPKVLTAVAGTTSADSYVYPPSVLSLTNTGFTVRCTSYLTVSVVWVAL